MRYPLQILAENEQSGIRAMVYRFTAPSARIYTENLLICGLTGSVNAAAAVSDAVIRTGTLLFVPGGKEVRFLPDAPSSLLLMIFIPDSALADSPVPIVLNSSGEESDRAYIPILRLLLQLTEMPLTSDTYHAIRQKACWQQLIYELLSRFSLPGVSRFTASRGNVGEDGHFPNAFGDILDFIDLNYQEEIQLNDLAKAFFYTPSHLSKQFSKYTGMKFTEYLAELRMTKAMPLLLGSSLEIRQISDRCGFANERTFQQAFQKKYGVRPSVYRRNFSKEDVHGDQEELQQALKSLHEAGIFRNLEDLLAKPDSFPEQGAAVPVLRRKAGTYNVSSSAFCQVAGKNNILHIDFCRDLLIDTIQEQVRMLKDNLHYEYIVLNGFISDDLQIYYSDVLNPDFSEKAREDRVLQYDFTMYVKILSFVKQIGLKPVIPLSFLPSFLARSADSFDTLYHSCIDMPYDMGKWEQYLSLLLHTLRAELGEWVESGKIFLWNAPDLHIRRTGRMTVEEYLDLYLHTYRIIRKCLPGISIVSPTITCTSDGLEFCRDYLQFCRENDCLPEQLLFTYYNNFPTGYRYLSPFQECNSFFNCVQDYLKSMKLAKPIPLCAFEYSMMFGRNRVCDALPSAMLPITFTLNNPDLFCGFGLYRGPELSTRTYSAGNMFTGIFSLLTKSGGRKAPFHALRFLNQLGDERIAAEPGLYITRKGEQVQILMYYEIPQNEWKREFPSGNPSAFYEDFPEMEFSVTLDHMELLRSPSEISGEHSLPEVQNQLLVREQYITPDSGSAYEGWMAEGRYLDEALCSLNNGQVMPKSQADGSPVVRTRIEIMDNSENSRLIYTYRCRLKPFEIRFVELLPL